MARCREYKKTDKGRASERQSSHVKRQLKTNIPEYVLLDGVWFEVDRKATWDVWSDVLLPKDERQQIRELCQQAVELSESTGVKHHVDHIIPVSKGGEHRLINLQIITADENLSKHNQLRSVDAELFCKRLFNI